MKNLIVIAFLFTGLSIQAQDTLFKRDGSIIPVTIKGESNGIISYVIHGSKDNREHHIHGSGLFRLHYKDGSKRFFNETGYESKAKNVKKQPMDGENPRNHIFMIPTDLFARQLTLGYERFSKSGHSSFYFPVSVGLGGQYERTSGIYGYYSANKIAGLGVGLNHYPGLTPSNGYFYGILLDITAFRYEYSSQYYAGRVQNPYDPTIYYDDYRYENNTSVGYAVALTFQNGIIIQPTSNFLMTFKIGMGINMTSYIHDSCLEPDCNAITNYYPTIRGSITMGYSF